MFNFRTAAIAATMGFAFMATPALAQGTCEYGQPIQVTLGGGQENLTNQEAVRRAVASPQGQQLLVNAPAECRSFVVSESLRISGLDPNAQLAPNTTVQIAIPASYTPAAASQPPVNTGGSQETRSGGGAAIDAEIAELRRQIATLEVGGGDPTEIAALRADVASLRAERVQANRPSVVRTTQVVRGETRVVRETRIVNQGLNDEDRSIVDSWANARGGISNALGRLFGSGEDDPATAEREDGIIGGLQAADADHNDQIEELKGWKWWFLWTLLPILGALVLAGLLARWYFASNKKVDDGFTRIDQQFDSVDADLRVDLDSLEGIKLMPEGQEGLCRFTIDGDMHGLVVAKAAGDCVTLDRKVGAVEIGTPVSIRKLQSTLRKAFRDYPESFANLKIV